MRNDDITLSTFIINFKRKSTKNLTAYEILEKFQKIKKVQPMTVSCFTCKNCGTSEELITNLFSSVLKKTKSKFFDLSIFDLEILSNCKRCN